MAQKEILEEKSSAPKISQLVPVKLENKTSFLDYLQFELTHIDYTGAGNATKAEVGIKLDNVTAAIGAGALNLDYYDPLFFITPRIEIDGQPGNFDLYLEAGFPYIAGRGDVRPSFGLHLSSGAVWELIEPGEHGGFGFRLGVELRGRMDGKQINMPSEVLAESGFGTSVTYEPVTVYAIERIFFGVEYPYAQSIGDLEAYHKEIKAGLVVALEGANLGVGFFKTSFETGGEISVEIEAGDLVPRIYGWGSSGGELFGYEAGFGVELGFGAERKQGKIKFKKGFGGERGGWSDVTSRDFEQPTLEWTRAEMDAAIESSRHFNATVAQAETFDEFIDAYKGRPRREILDAVKWLGWNGKRNYDDTLTSNLGKSRKQAKRIKDIGADGAYQSIRNSYLHGYEVTRDAGICANINMLPAKFLRGVGFEAYVLAVGGRKTGHIITVAFDPESKKSYLCDYFDLYEYSGKRIWPLIQDYARREGIIVQGVYLFGKDDKLVGYYQGPEGKLMDEVAGSAEDKLKEGLLGRKAKRR